MFPCLSRARFPCTAGILQFGSAGANAERFGIARAGHDKHALPSSTAKILWDWALPAIGNAGVAHCRDTLLLVAAGAKAQATLCCRGRGQFTSCRCQTSKQHA